VDVRFIQVEMSLQCPHADADDDDDDLDLTAVTWRWLLGLTST